MRSMQPQSYNIKTRELATAGDHVIPQNLSRLALVVINAGTDPASILHTDSSGVDHTVAVLPPNTQWTPPEGINFVGELTVSKTTNSVVLVMEYS